MKTSQNQNYSTQQVLKTLTAVSQIAEILLRSEHIDSVLPEILGKLGEAVNVSRVYVYKRLNIESDDVYVRQIFEWLSQSSDIPISSTESRDVPMIASGYKRWVNKLENDEVISGIVTEFPDSEHEMLKAQHILSICVVPIILDDNFWGFIGFDDCIYERNWGTVEIDALRSAANILGAYFKMKDAESALKESELLFKNIFNNVSIGLYRTTPRGEILMANPAMINKLGFDSFDELAQHNIDDQSLISDLNRETFLNLMRDKGEIYGYETTWKKKDGTIIYIRENSRAVKDANGNVIYFEGSVEDITSQKELENHLIKNQKLESVGLLAGGIAHDFNNLLTGILGNIVLAKLEIDTTSEAYFALSEAEMASLHAKELTNQLLTFSTGAEPVRKQTDLMRLLVDATNLVIKNKNIKPIFRIKKNLSFINVDQGQIRQVVYNLVINAEQSMPNGGEITIEGKNFSHFDNSIPSLPEGEYIQIQISDEGVGIPDKIISKVFDPYYTTKQSGSGLGLATAYAIIKKHDGYITLDSVLGEGTTAIFYLPVSEINIKKETDISKTNTESSTASKKVLLMDDEGFIRDLANRVLKKAGFDVTVVENGEAVLLRYKQLMETYKKYDIVVLDLIVANGMGGQETITYLKQLDPDVKVIACSGYSNDPVISYYKQYGFDGVVAKPYAPEDLVNAVKAILK